MPRSAQYRINLKDLEVYVGVGCLELRQHILYGTDEHTNNRVLVFFQQIKNSLMDFDSLCKGMSEYEVKTFLERMKMSCQNILMMLLQKDEWDSLHEIIDTIDILLS
uniref:Uncharacterized protein n=1 Tax=Guillardia theta TaxID=55529 RepID=A0A7S4L7Z3_GUITH|mmetsp:Transcript_39325/g.123960  ORF Transcript_39325/g.123960 Transcript_39325/m.123960 type:complete len:107 (+) Transcript_39325:65-385(+)